MSRLGFDTTPSSNSIGPSLLVKTILTDSLSVQQPKQDNHCTTADHLAWSSTVSYLKSATQNKMSSFEEKNDYESKAEERWFLSSLKVLPT